VSIFPLPLPIPVDPPVPFSGPTLYPPVRPSDDVPAVEGEGARLELNDELSCGARDLLGPAPDEGMRGKCARHLRNQVMRNGVEGE